MTSSPPDRQGAIHVVALGASTAVGRDAFASAAAVRAGVAGFTEHPFMVDTAGQPMTVAMAPWLEVGLVGAARFEALLVPALEQALSPLAASPHPDLKVALALALPAPRPGLPPDLEQELRTAVAQRFSRALAAIGLFPGGHASGVVGLCAAFGKLLEGSLDGCVVAGVDSYMSPESLEWLEANDQLHGAGPLNNAWGFVPGEAAGAALLLNGDAAARLGLQPMARVAGVGNGFEENRIKTQTVCIGAGLTNAFRDALSGLPDGTKVTDIYCDMNGEPYRADEFGFAAVRTKGHFVSASDFLAPADCWGDVSAASVPLAIMLAAVASQKQYANGEYGFVWASSEGGERGAVLLQLAPTADHAASRTLRTSH